MPPQKDMVTDYLEMVLSSLVKPPGTGVLAEKIENSVNQVVVYKFYLPDPSDPLFDPNVLGGLKRMTQRAAINFYPHYEQGWTISLTKSDEPPPGIA